MMREHSTARAAWAPWLEGLSLAAVVAFVVWSGGEVVRASYHGYMHAAIGEAVIHDGWRPENPYHAGEPLRYYTLYPWLGASIGRWFGFGPLAAFAWLNVLGALFFAPALDALGRGLNLSFVARRFAFGASVLAMNGLGWVGWLWNAPPDAVVPVFAFQSMTWTDYALGWDARLQGFLPKFLNVSSFAVALPAALHAIAHSTYAHSKYSIAAAATFASIALALNPLAGAFAGICMAFFLLPQLKGASGKLWLAWVFSGVQACLLALLFLLGAFVPAPEGESLTGVVRFQASGWMNFLGPCGILLVPAVLAWKRWRPEPGLRLAWLAALVLAVAVVVWARLPWGNEYKLARWTCIWLAMPFGIWAAQTRTTRLLAGALLLACVPSSLLIVGEYLRWGEQGVAPPQQANQDGVLGLVEEDASRAFPASLAQALAERPQQDVLWMHLAHPTSRLPRSVVQGNLWAPSVRQALFVDVPQVHNDRIEDLAKRLEWTEQFFAGQTAGDSETALRAAAAHLRGRTLLVLTHATAAKHSVLALQAVGATRLAAENGFELWCYELSAKD